MENNSKGGNESKGTKKMILAEWIFWKENLPPPQIEVEE